ncbi:MAG: hypothetical protein ACRCYO_13585 [Bacteroidia bacterium]
MPSALVIKTDLPSFTPVFNRMPVCVFQSDAPTLALPGFKYVVDLYIEGQTFGGVGYYRYEIPPEPVLGYGVVDIHGQCETYVNSAVAPYNAPLPFLLGANANGSQSIIKVNLRYGYVYLLAGVKTYVPNEIIGSTKYAWNACLSKKELMDYFSGSPLYLMNTSNGVNAQFLTDMKHNKVSIKNLGHHQILCDIPNQADYLQVITYDSLGNIIQTVKKANIVPQTLTSSRNYQVATAPKSLNNMTGAFITGSQPVITPLVSRYTVQVFDNSNLPIGEVLNFEIQEPCRYSQRRLHFLNRLGGIDCFNFNLRSQKSQEVESKGYKMDKYRIVTDGLSYSYVDPENITTFVKTSDKIILRSDYLTTEENDWLKQLISSPEIYLEFTDPSGVQQFQAVEKLTGRSWLEKETGIDKLFNLEVEIVMSQSNFRQRR